MAKCCPEPVQSLYAIGRVFIKEKRSRERHTWLRHIEQNR